jgi:hypothetical protein
MRNGILASVATLFIGASIGFAQSNVPASATTRSNSNPPRLFPGLFSFLFKRQAPPPPPPPVAIVKSNVPAAKPTPTPSKVAHAFVPPTARATTTTADVIHTARLGPPSHEEATTALPQFLPAAGSISSPRIDYTHLLEVSGHDANYSWITGVLTQKPGMPGIWFIHYLPPDALPDFHGGILPIQTRDSFEGLRQGDLVTVSGYIIMNAEVTPQQRMTAFSAEQVTKVRQP